MKPVLSPGLPFNNLHLWLKLIHMLYFVYHNLQFRLPLLPSLLWILLKSESFDQCCSAKKVFLQIPQNWQENTEKGILHKFFHLSFAKFLITFFFKERVGRPLHHKHSFCLLSHHDFSSFQKQCHIYFLPEYFFGLTCRLETRVSSVFQALSQKAIFNPVEHLRWSFFCGNI